VLILRRYILLRLAPAEMEVGIKLLKFYGLISGLHRSARGA